MLEQETIKQILLDEHYLDEAALVEATEYMAKSGGDFVNALIANDIMTKPLIGQAVAEHFGVRFFDIEKQVIDEELFYLIPELVARSQHVIVVGRHDGVVQIALTNPNDEQLIANIEKRVDGPVQVLFAFDDDIETALLRYKVDLKQAFTDTVEELRGEKDKDKTEDIITHTVDMLLRYGSQNHASDIHIEPYRKKVNVRFRIDGVLHDVLEIEKALFDPIVSRIKILSRIRTDEHRAAQDGKMRFKLEDDVFMDVRVSLVPTKNGENIVMRLLASAHRRFELEALGMLESDLKKMDEAIKHPHGMILVTGPTGSGKSTTLYAVLKLLNNRDVHIATIEDPIEYDVEGITQIQVNEQTNLTFADGLRAIVRQDPDIIMVGEIRDEETAGIAVNSALTGHLVLSTLHTNDAATTLPRLLDMGIEPFLASSTVNIIVAQRLVRKICSACRVSYAPSKEEKERLKANEAILNYLKTLKKSSLAGVRFYKGGGCKVCAHTGYDGRIGIFELLEMTDQIRELVMQHTDADIIKKEAHSAGMTTLLEDGIAKVMQGVTTIDEVLRVARD